MKYSRCNYKVESPFRVYTPVKGHFIDTQYYTLFKSGELLVKYNYTWDGATGAVDSNSLIKSSCIHDIFCELINAKLLHRDLQEIVDNFLVEKMSCYWEWLKENGTYCQKIKEYILRPFISFRKWYILKIVRTYQKRKKIYPRKIILEVP